LARLENMVSMTHLHLPSRSIRQQIASALHLVVQISRMRDGVRRITYVSEVVGIEADTITMQDIFVFGASGEDKKGRLEGAFQWTGIVPRFVRRAAYYGEYAALSKALGVKLPAL
jgi:pilus assembly protein CpaF